MVFPRNYNSNRSCNIQQHPYQRYAAYPRATEGTDGTATEGTQSNQATDEKNKWIIGKAFGGFKRNGYLCTRWWVIKRLVAHLWVFFDKRSGKAERIEQFIAERGIEYGLQFVTFKILNSPDCLYIKKSSEFLQSYENLLTAGCKTIAMIFIFRYFNQKTAVCAQIILNS